MMNSGARQQLSTCSESATSPTVRIALTTRSEETGGYVCEDEQRSDIYVQKSIKY